MFSGLTTKNRKYPRMTTTSVRALSLSLNFYSHFYSIFQFLSIIYTFVAEALLDVINNSPLSPVCDECRTFFLEECQVHGPIVFMADRPVAVREKDRAKKTLPAGFEVYVVL